MVEKLIIKLLKRISEQLEAIAAAQGEIRREILALRNELSKFEDDALKNIEERVATLSHRNFLN